MKIAKQPGSFSPTITIHFILVLPPKTNKRKKTLEAKTDKYRWLIDRYAVKDFRHLKSNIQRYMLSSLEYDNRN